MRAIKPPRAVLRFTSNSHQLLHPVSGLSPMRAFLTGTDTGVGKTFVTALLTRALRHAGCGTVALKPLCCGERDDVEILRNASGCTLTADQTNPVWFKTPACPLVAARQPERSLESVFLELTAGDR